MGFLFFKNKEKEGKKPSKNADASAPSARELYDLAQIRQWAGELPDEEQRAEILSAMDELERLDQAQAGGGQACLRAFLLKAAGRAAKPPPSRPTGRSAVRTTPTKN